MRKFLNGYNFGLGRIGGYGKSYEGHWKRVTHSHSGSQQFIFIGSHLYIYFMFCRWKWKFKVQVHLYFLSGYNIGPSRVGGCGKSCQGY